MARLQHEIWLDPDEDGVPLPGCCLAGPDGDGFRRMLGPKACLVHRFESGSHFETMTIYYQFVDYGEYVSSDPWDMEPYPEDWKRRQE